MSPFWWFPIASITLNLFNASVCGLFYGNWWAAGYWIGAGWMTLAATYALEGLNK